MEAHVENAVPARRRSPGFDASTFALNRDGFRAAIRCFPMLEPNEEYALARSWCDGRERKAAHRLVTSHLRLVVTIAARYRGYGLPVSDLISEGNVGLVHALDRFRPDKGCRFATYATWWISAAIQEHVLRAWSLVKIGTTANQKKLFFGLRRAKSRIAAFESGDLRPDQVEAIASRLGVSGRDVIEMNRGLGGDISLNTPAGDDDKTGEWLDRLADDGVGPEVALAESQERDNRRRALIEALSALDARERRIFEGRHLIEQPIKLEDLAGEFGVSRERVRQIEVRAFEKVQTAVKARFAAIQGA
jgi:RNA polymerase sigma-32 factor